MSLETLLEAARYVEQQEKKRARAASISSLDRTHYQATQQQQHQQPVVTIQSNHIHHDYNAVAAEPRGAKFKKERSDPDDLFCEEKMLIIDEEDPIELAKANGNHNNPAVANQSPTVGLASSALHQSSQEIIQNQQFTDNHLSSNQIQSDVSDAAGQDNKKPRNGPCVIRSGTREVHNKLEKNRRAHLKECFELLKKQLPSQDEKKSSNLSILHAAIRHIQSLRRKEREYEHEMEKLAREKIAFQQRLATLKKELSATWEHIDFNALMPENNSPIESSPPKNESGMEVDVASLSRGGTRYSSTSSLSSATTVSSPQAIQNCSTMSVASGIHSQMTTASVLCQNQGIHIVQSPRSSPPTNSVPAVSSSVVTTSQEKLSISTTVITQPHPPVTSSQTHHHQPAQLHLPMLNTGQGLATIMPTLQHLGTGLRVIPGDTRQLLVTHATGAGDSRPLIAVQSNAANGEHRPVALVVHSTTTANDNRATLVHSANLSTSEVRPVTFVHSGNEARPIVLATAHSQPINVTNTQNRRPDGSVTAHKMVSGMTIVGNNGTELARCGAELNILPNGVLRSVKVPLTVQGGLTLSHSGVSLQPAAGKQGSTVIQSTPTSEGIAHIVGQHGSISGLTPIVTPMTVVSQGSQVILAPAGKMITTPILKSVGQVPIVNAQYLNTTTLMKPVVVVSSSPAINTTASSHQTPTASLASSSVTLSTAATQANGV